MEHVVIEREAPTGTTVQLVYVPNADPTQPWETVCADNGGVCSHAGTRGAVPAAPGGVVRGQRAATTVSIDSLGLVRRDARRRSSCVTRHAIAIQT
jgi:hypothetical protein